MFAQADLSQTHRYEVIGRKEAVIALNETLGPSQESRAVDITDGVAFDWRRWIGNLSEGRDLVGSGVVRVFACRWGDTDSPIIAVCRTDGTYATLNPQCQNYPTTQRIHSHTVYPSWQTVRMFQTAATVDDSWMQRRYQPFWTT